MNINNSNSYPNHKFLYIFDGCEFSDNELAEFRNNQNCLICRTCKLDENILYKFLE